MRVPNPRVEGLPQHNNNYEAEWPSGLRRRFAKSVFVGSNPTSASIVEWPLIPYGLGIFCV